MTDTVPRLPQPQSPSSPGSDPAAAPRAAGDLTDTLLRFAGRYGVVFRAACVWGAIVATAVLMRAVLEGGGRRADFGLFHETIQRVRLGLPMYGEVAGSTSWLPGPNYNPPHFYVLFAPFGWLPFPISFLAWTLLGLAAGVFIARRTERALSVRREPRAVLIIAAFVLANAALASTLRSGQLSLLLAVPVCLAWLATRERRWAAAGVWIGLAASIKPFLLVVLAWFVLIRQWRAAALMTLAGLAAVAAGIGVFGLDAFRGWIEEIGAQRMTHHFLNASAQGLLARAGVASEMVGRLAAAAGLAVTLLAASRARDVDRAWIVLLSGALLWSPLGWIYYVWFVIPPLVAIGVQGRLFASAVVAAVLWTWPPYTFGLAIATPAIACTLGSVYFWGLISLWAGACREGVSLPAAARTSGGHAASP